MGNLNPICIYNNKIDLCETKYNIIGYMHIKIIDKSKIDIKIDLLVEIE